MCLILFHCGRHPRYRLILAANRDEFHARPTRHAAYWPDRPGVLAGRDLAAGGTWLAVHRSGRMAAITNFRDPAANDPRARSRGDLVLDFAAGRQSPADFLAGVERRRTTYNPFNLLVADGADLWYFGSREGRVRRLAPGTHALSNHLLDTPWPKVASGRAALARLAGEGPVTPEGLLALLLDRETPDDGRLPDTGIGLEWERRLAPRFIVSDVYGTRSATVLLVTHRGRVTLVEWTFRPGADPPRITGRRAFGFTAERFADAAGRPD